MNTMYGIQGGFIGNDGGLMAGVNRQAGSGAPKALQRLMGPQLPMAMGIPGAAGNMGGMMAMPQAAGFDRKFVS